MTLKDLVIDHLEYTFERETWQPPLAQAIEGLTAAQAAWKPQPAGHSIWQIVCHVTLWKQAVLDGLAGRPQDADVLERRDWDEVSGTDAEWEADVQRLLRQATHDIYHAGQIQYLRALQGAYNGGWR